MENYVQQVAWQNFFAVQVAEAEIDEAEHEGELELAKAVAMLNSTQKVTQARLERDIADPVRKAREKYLTARAKRKLLTVAMENRERCANILSRELSRRVGRSNGTTGGRKGYGP